jgi:hypothetical protein
MDQRPGIQCGWQTMSSGPQRVAFWPIKKGIFHTSSYPGCLLLRGNLPGQGARDKTRKKNVRLRKGERERERRKEGREGGREGGRQIQEIRKSGL